MYGAKPDGPIKAGLIVIHEVWGLNAHIKEVADRFASEGYFAIAPDLLHGSDMGPIDPSLIQRSHQPETRDEAQKDLRAAMAPVQAPEFAVQTTATLKRLFAWLIDQPETNGKVAVVGFCFGGTYSFGLAVAEPRLQGAVAFYGHANQSVEELKQITCPVLAFYGTEDTRLMDTLPELTNHMKEAGVSFTNTVYPDAGHAFFNDTNSSTYRPEAATDSWKRTLAFLGGLV